MNQFLYEKSVTYRGYLIIPFVFSCLGGHKVYSYCLLSDRGRNSKFHKAKNPAKLYSSKLEEIIAIAKQHLDKWTKPLQNNSNDYFQDRYIYKNSLIIIHQAAGKYFYDHYAADSLNNIAAPKLFDNSQECLNWIKQGLDRHKIN